MTQPREEPLNRLRTALAGQYTIEREVGRGGMAIVFLAHESKHNRRVAIKVLNEELALAIGPDRFLREIEILARLTHPNILPLHDSGEVDGLLYYVMPFVEGESLRERLAREGQLPVQAALHIAREVADALGYAHSVGVVHRDIKPANIMIEADHAVVADFGIAYLAHGVDAERLTTSGMSPGTPRYMSPEQASGSSDVDGRSDIYSLGCVLYEMLCGDPPYSGYSRQVVLARKMLEPVPGMRSIRPVISPALEQVTLTALSRTPADRFGTANDFAAALDRAEFEQRRALSFETPVQVAPYHEDETEEGSHWKVSGKVAFFGALLMLTAIGLLNVAVYEYRMRMPADSTPLRKDLTLIGVRALIPGAIYSFAIILAFVVVKYIVRLLLAGVRAVPRAGGAIDTRSAAIAGWMRRLRRDVDPVIAAEVFLICAILVSIPVLLRFGPLLSNLWLTDTEMLSTSARPVHREFTLGFALLIVGLTWARRHLFGWIRSRRIPSRRVALARWGSLAWILILVFLMTAPWQVLWHNDMPRALVDGQRAYILRENDEDIVIYNAVEKRSERYPVRDAPPFVRLGTTGYVFETDRQFAEGGPPR